MVRESSPPLPCWPSRGRTAAGAQSKPAPPAQAPEDDPDRDPNRNQPDFTIVNLPTTLRVPRFKSAFRVTHRFGRPFGAGDFGDLASDLFGLDSGAQIGLEYRFGLMRGGQVGIHRTSGKTIEFFAQYNVLQQRDNGALGLDAFASIDGTNNFSDSYTPALGIVVSRELGSRRRDLRRADVGEQLEPAAERADRRQRHVHRSVSARASASGRPSTSSASSFRGSATSRASTTGPSASRSAPAGTCSSSISRTASARRWASSRAAAPAARTGISVSTSRGSSSDDQTSIHGGVFDRPAGIRRLRVWRRRRRSRNRTFRWRWRWRRRNGHGGRDDHDHGKWRVTARGDRRPGFASHVRQQRHPAARHGVGSASGRTRTVPRSRWASSRLGRAGPRRISTAFAPAASTITIRTRTPRCRARFASSSTIEGRRVRRPLPHSAVSPGFISNT